MSGFYDEVGELASHTYHRLMQIGELLQQVGMPAHAEDLDELASKHIQLSARCGARGEDLDSPESINDLVSVTYHRLLAVSRTLEDLGMPTHSADLRRLAEQHMRMNVRCMEQTMPINLPLKGRGEVH